MWACLLATHICRYLRVRACVCKTYGVQEPGVCYSLCSHTVFHQALSCSPQTLSIWFHSLEPPSAAARGWMISNTWEPWEPTLGWNNRGPVSAGALEESETAGGDVRIIRTLPHLLQPLFPSHALIHECEKSCVIGIYQQQRITSCSHACSCTKKRFNQHCGECGQSQGKICPLQTIELPKIAPVCGMAVKFE